MPSVIVTFCNRSPGTEEATSWAMPRTDVELSELVPLNSTAAEDAFWLSPNSWFWVEGMTSSTCAPETPWMLSIVCSSWPCSARW